MSAPKASTTRRSRAKTLGAHLLDARLVPRVEDVQEQRVGGPAGLDDEAAGHQRDHLGDDGEHEVRAGPQVDLDHGVAGLAMELKGRPGDLGARDDDIGEEADDEPASRSGRTWRCIAQGRQRKHEHTTMATTSPPTTLNTDSRPTGHPHDGQPAQRRQLQAARGAPAAAARRRLARGSSRPSGQHRGDVELAVEEVAGAARPV